MLLAEIQENGWMQAKASHTEQKGMEKMIKAGIIGATGYAGGELVRLLTAHPEVEIAWYGSRSYIDKKYYEVYRNMFRIVDDKCMDDNMEELADLVDVIFTATPQGLCASLVNEEILSKVKIVDLSADFRIKDVKTYEEWYGIEHKSPQFIGTSGAGRGAKVDNLYCEVNENIKAYGVASHRHTPEIEEQLSYAAGQEVLLNFTPHLVPMNRGILITAYASLMKEQLPDGTSVCPSYEKVRAAYDKYYDKEKFVRVLDKNICPETKWVEGSNYVDVNFKIDERTGRIIMMGAMDNLVKGAAGQAVQNMNLMFGMPETEGLELVPMFP